MNQEDEIRVIKLNKQYTDTKHGLMREWGVTGSTVGSQNISMGYGVVPPKLRSTAHYHSFETAIYVVKGRARAFFGAKSEKYFDVSEGDFLYIPAGVVHCTENLGDTPVEYIVSRNAPEDIAIEVG